MGAITIIKEIKSIHLDFIGGINMSCFRKFYKKENFNRYIIHQKYVIIIAKMKKLGGKGLDYNLGDIVKTKKQHPCGSKLWEITRVGVDFKLKCQGCGHVVMLPREKAIKAITKKIEKT